VSDGLGRQHADYARGFFVISQDFELHWGVRDKRSVDDYRENLLGVRDGIPATLALFSKYGVHATWATVGFLFCEGRDELRSVLPKVLPKYVDERYSPYSIIDGLGKSETEDPFHFAPSLLRLIASTPDQEIGTHTFSHFYCLEPGQDQEAFEADLAAAVTVAQKFDVKLRSLVFPRNQVNAAYLPLCARAGIRAFRGTPRGAAYLPKASAGDSLVVRAARLVDHYLPISGHNAGALESIGRARPFDIPASSFLRPYSRSLAVLDGLRLRRIKAAMTAAARQGRVYHLWWHPHNFGVNLHENLTFLSAILEHFAELRARYGMRSASMTELADVCDATSEAQRAA